MQTKVLQSKLRHMMLRDQQIRRRLIVLQKNGAGETSLRRCNQQMAAIDRANQTDLLKILEDGGWPSRAQYGDAAMENAYCIASHITDNTLLGLCVSLLRRRIRQRDAITYHYAYLADLLAARCGRKQRYGTQFVRLGTSWAWYPIIDPRTVNTRRRALGICTIEVQLKQLEKFLDRQSSGC